MCYKGKYRIQVSVRILDDDDNELYRYSELVRTGQQGKILAIKTRESTDNIVRTISKDVRKICLVKE